MHPPIIWAVVEVFKNISVMLAAGSPPILSASLLVYSFAIGIYAGTF